ncbi:MAG: ECF-type sigma factor [Planctomycetota bacterium]
MAGSVTMLLHCLRTSKKRDETDSAAEKLWEFFYDKLCKKVLSRGRHNFGVWDEEDVAAQALGDLIVSVQSAEKRKNYMEVRDRVELWKLLSVIATRQMKDWQRKDTALKRGGAATTTSIEQDHDSELAAADNCPQLHSAVLEQCNRLFSSLREPRLKTTAGMKIRGYTTYEIASELECSTRTVKTMVKRIKSMWIAISDD